MMSRCCDSGTTNARKRGVWFGSYHNECRFDSCPVHQFPMNEPDYDEELNDDPYLPDDGDHKLELPLSNNDKEIVRSLSDMFGQAWIHGF